MPPGIGDREGAHLAGADLRKELSGIKKTPVGMTPEHGEQRRATAIVRDVVVLNPRCPSNHSHWEIPRSPRSGVSKVKLSRILFHGVNHLAERFPGRFRPNSKNGRAVINPGDRSKLIRTDGYLLAEGKDGIRPRATEHQRVAIGLCPDGSLRTYGSSSAWFEYHQHGLADILMGYARERPGRQIMRTAGSVRDDELDGFRRKLLRERDGSQDDYR